MHVLHSKFAALFSELASQYKKSDENIFVSTINMLQSEVKPIIGTFHMYKLFLQQSKDYTAEFRTKNSSQ